MKRGANQVDWAISMFIFLLYLFWFFIFLQPMLNPPTEVNTLLSLVREGFEDETAWEVQRIPIMFHTNSSESYVPVRIPPPDWPISQMSLWPATYIALDEGELVFIANLSPGKRLWLMHSGENYTDPKPVPALNADYFSATINPTMMQLSFNDSIVSAIAFNGTKLKDLNFFANRVSLPRNQTNATFTPIFAKYSLIQQEFNITSYIYLHRSEVRMHIRGNKPTLLMTTELFNATRYYANNLYEGPIDYTAQTCQNLSSDTIDFSSSSGIQFLFDEEVNMSFCGLNSSRLFFNATLKNMTEFRIILHSGDYQNRELKLSNHTTSVGAIETLNGASWKNITKLNATEHDELKRRWSIPMERDFSFTVQNTTETLIEHFPIQPPTIDVYAETRHLLIIDKYARINSTQVIFRIW
ncbi:MAG: hypothetical protein ABIH34_08490 [Nanoarchaeota archaeon]